MNIHVAALRTLIKEEVRKVLRENADLGPLQSVIDDAPDERREEMADIFEMLAKRLKDRDADDEGRDEDQRGGTEPEWDAFEDDWSMDTMNAIKSVWDEAFEEQGKERYNKWGEEEWYRAYSPNADAVMKKFQSAAQMLRAMS